MSNNIAGGHDGGDSYEMEEEGTGTGTYEEYEKLTLHDKPREIAGKAKLGLARSEFSLDTVFAFGNKHRGKTLAEVIETNPSYLTWAIEHEVIEFDAEALDAMAIAGVRGL